MFSDQYKDVDRILIYTNYKQNLFGAILLVKINLFLDKRSTCTTREDGRYTKQEDSCFIY